MVRSLDSNGEEGDSDDDDWGWDWMASEEENWRIKLRRRIMEGENELSSDLIKAPFPPIGFSNKEKKGFTKEGEEGFTLQQFH